MNKRERTGVKRKERGDERGQGVGQLPLVFTIHHLL